MCVCSFMINTWSNMKTYKFHFSDVNVCHFYAFGILWIPPSRLYSRRYNNHGWPGITSRKEKNTKTTTTDSQSLQRDNAQGRQFTFESLRLQERSAPRSGFNCFLSLQRHYIQCVCVCVRACVRACVRVCVCVAAVVWHVSASARTHKPVCATGVYTSKSSLQLKKTAALKTMM